MKNKLHKILGTVKPEAESWVDLFIRLDKEGRMDHKTLIKVVGVILDEYEKEERK